MASDYFDGHFNIIHEPRVKCWEPKCRAWARIRLYGAGCDATAFCPEHFFAEMRDYYKFNIGFDFEVETP